MVAQIKSEISRSDVVNSLARFRQEWQASVDGKSLLDVPASVGLMLVDVVMMIGLSSEEQKAVLGEPLHTEFIKAVRHNNRNG